jgi:hypothetical protein
MAKLFLPLRGDTTLNCVELKARLTALPKIQHVFSSMTADMSLSEKLHVVSFLRQMNDYLIKNTSKS